MRLPAGCVRLAGVPVGCSEASRGRGGGARRLLQVCSQFDQQTAAAAAINAGLVVVADGWYLRPAVAAESGLEWVVACFVLCREGVSPSSMHLPFGIAYVTHPAGSRTQTPQRPAPRPGPPALRASVSARGSSALALAQPRSRRLCVQ